MTAAERRTQLAQQFRVDSVRMSAAAKSGHPTSSMSAADLLAVLADGYLRFDFDDPKSPANDRLVLSKGHASVLLYAFYRAAGVVSEEDILDYRNVTSMLEGHPTPRIPWVDVATGSLGQGLPIGVGMAIAGKHLDRLGNRVWVLCGDSEMAEGSMWEAFEHAAHYELDNLTRPAPRRSAGTRSRSTGTTSGRSTRRTPPPSPRPASRPWSSRAR
jgi:transketolase